jgi:4-alpha-glucanotransferase
MIRLALSCKAAMAVAPMQDFLGLGSAARLNRPGTTLNNWRWRMAAEALGPERVEDIAGLVEAAHRFPERRIPAPGLAAPSPVAPQRLDSAP